MRFSDGTMCNYNVDVLNLRRLCLILVLEIGLKIFENINLNIIFLIVVQSHSACKTKQAIVLK